MPGVAIAVYGLAGIWVALLGQAGMTVRGAYDVLVSMGISKVVGGTALRRQRGGAAWEERSETFTEHFARVVGLVHGRESLLRV